MEPGSGVSPFLASEVHGDAKGSRNVLVTEPGELPKFHHPGRDGVFNHKAIQCLVESEKVVIRFRADLVDEVDSTQTTAALQPGLAPCRLHQDSPHRLGGRGEEVAAAVPVLGLLHVHQPQVGFMNQCRRLECMAG